MARRRRRQIELDEDEADDLPRARAPRRRGRWRLRLALLAAAVAAAIAAGPTIVAGTPLRNLLLARATPPEAGQLSAAAGQFTWLGSQALGGIVLRDADGQPLAEIQRASIDRSLVALAVNSRHLGRVHIAGPVVRLTTRPGGSNLEDLAARLAAAAASSQQRDSTAG
ncbi:MAG TPA: hypothetical protein PJ982_08515, partial [Lacipirellulaceae bacterium]|nr:hypothetical protein [Lacipirellulaceae bacterium]